MGIFSYSRALGVAVMAWGMVSFGPASDLAAGTLLSPGSADLVRKSAEPFGVFAFRLSGGGLWEKWLGVQRKLDDERVQLALCDGDRERCVSPAALRFLAIVDNAKAREGRARLGEINRAINLAIHPMSDLAQYGEIDVWSSPLLTFTTGSGDCEDYAIAKFVALHQAGIPPEDLRIVIMHDTIRGEDHAVAAARLDGHWLTSTTAAWRWSRTRISGITGRYTSSINTASCSMSIAPLLAVAPDWEPSAALKLAAEPGLISSSN